MRKKDIGHCLPAGKAGASDVRRRGFTLVEVLVVVALLGVLMTLVFASYGRAQKQARDTHRKSDIKQYQVALENFSGSNSYLYPSWSASVSAHTSLCTSLSGYMSGCLSAPRSSEDASYTYKYISDGTGSGSVSALNWVLSAKIENSSGKLWVVCSNGKSGEWTSAADPSSSTCPL